MLLAFFNSQKLPSNISQVDMALDRNEYELLDNERDVK